MQPFAVQKWESGCPPFQQPAYPPKPAAVLHLAFFVVPAALSAPAVAHGILCHRHRTKRETSRKNSILKLCVVKNGSAAI